MQFLISDENNLPYGVQDAPEDILPAHGVMQAVGLDCTPLAAIVGHSG